MNQAVKKVNRVLDYIENNIKEQINLDDISNYADLSKYHLNRLFKVITQNTLMGYVRNRKISESIHDLIYTNLKIIDIAVEYGFQYEQSYIRSFKSIYQFSPDKVRKEKLTLPLFEKINIQTLYPIGEDGIMFKPSMVLKPEFHLIGISHQIYYKENKDYHIANKVGNDFFSNYSGKVPNVKNPSIYFGFVKRIPEVTDYKFYIPSVEVNNLKDIPTGMTGFTVPTRKYVVFKYIGSHHPRLITVDCFQSIYKYIFGEWFPASYYKISDYFSFERIDVQVATEDYCTVEMFIPVKEKI